MALVRVMKFDTMPAWPFFCFFPMRDSFRLAESFAVVFWLFGFFLPGRANFCFGMVAGGHNHVRDREQQRTEVDGARERH